MAEENKATESRRSFFLGLTTGVVVLVLLGGVFMLGASYGDGSTLKLGQGGKSGNTNSDTTLQPNPSQPTAPTADRSKIAKVTKDEHIIGSPNAKVTIVEYSDLECPFCKRFHPTMQQVVKDYGNQVAWIYRHFPLSFHANAQKESEASECAAELGGNEAFWKFIDAIYERTTSNGYGFALDKLGPLAKEIGLDQTKFQTCLDSGKYASKVTAQYEDGAKGGVTGTPGTFINDQYLPGALPLDQVKQVIDAELK